MDCDILITVLMKVFLRFDSEGREPSTSALAFFHFLEQTSLPFNKFVCKNELQVREIVFIHF